MKKHSLVILLTAFCVTLSAGAQQRWMVGVDGAIGLSAYAPRFLAGAETSFYLLDRPHFKLGPGVGLTFSGERSSPYQIYLKKGLYVPLFLRGEYDVPLGNVSGFALLDLGYQFGVYGWSYDGEKTMKSSWFCYFPGWFVSPQVGLNLGRQMYLSAGLWIPSTLVSDKSGHGYEIPLSLSLRAGVRF